MKKNNIIICILFLFVVSSCKTLNTQLSIAEQKLPENFNTSTTDTASIATINWKEYFADSILIKLIDTALYNNPDLQVALQRIEIARSGVRFSTSKLLPKLDGNISAGSTTEYEPGKAFATPINDFYVGLTGSWEIDIWKKLRNQQKAAVSNYLASNEGKNFVTGNLVADIAITYYELLALDNELEILEQTIHKQKEALDVVKFQKETGKTNELAVQQFQAQLLNSKTLEKEIAQQIVETENKINFLLGKFPQTIVRKKEILFQKTSAKIASGIPSQLLSNRPDIREIEYQIAASKFDLQAAKAAFYPTANLSAKLDFQIFNSQFLFAAPASIGYSALGMLVAPLVNMNALKAQFNTAKANQLSLLYTHQKTILNAYVEVVNELSNTYNLQQINAFKKEQTEVLAVSVETATELYKTAKASYLEVLIAQQNSLQSKLEFINISKRQQIAAVKLYKVLGGGWK
ncbi:MAG: TolC family protein [Bacteroidetes bacterium]|nr:TolC family protein [Bacteroidota bacterium]MBS1591304.1 TolC family protein [Bacteroidota bacterium]